MGLVKHGGSLIQARCLAAKHRAAECKELPHVSIQPDERIKQRRNCEAKYLSIWIYGGRVRGEKKKQIGVPCENREIIHGYVNDTARHLTLTAIH